MKHLPIGIQHFDDLREKNSIYVDKTKLIFSLLEHGGGYFLSRPRRFGKSLLLSTMEQIALARKNLFCGLWIEDKWDWSKKYPVIRMSFAQVPYKDLGLEKAILETLLVLCKRFDITPNQTQSINFVFSQLLQDLHAKHGKVFLLIDEYDKPIIDYLETDTISTAKENQAIMKNFYSCLKDNGNLIHTLFVTGISKFAKVSIFSDLNHLSDLTLNPKYATLLGYTQAELEYYFDEHIEHFLKENTDFTKTTLLEQIKQWYNGFSWDGKNKIYNPFGILNFFSNNQFRNYWFESGTPTFLLKLMFKKNMYEFENIPFDVLSNNAYDLEKLELIPILFQTGYLTITKAIKMEDHSFNYILNYPNNEVQKSFYQFIINALCFTDGEDKRYVYRITHCFKNNDLAEIEIIAGDMFKRLPYDFYVEKEVAIHCLIHILFMYLGVSIESEVHTQMGRLDAAVFTSTHIYIFEFKINKSTDEAIEQITKKDYARKYSHANKTLIGIGANFVTDKRAFDPWKILTL
ncbi:hypothetical protein CHS0354_000616 [Potamilus streckersoni]|uniref:AAA-ATPase-like domain-containing protein n=1 Tax=Potamilus streckersoni TaxID=2493646 RepID=A0AAE0W936_9BIVA|nr:hypothetical protein CHS0354_000616 [Potamilus streckersoni]